VSLPTLKVQMDSGNLTAAGGFILDTSQLDTGFFGAGEPSWDFDITGYVRGGSTDRGTSNELQRVEAGTASLLLDARDGAFVPTNTLSAFYPNIVPMRRVRILATWASVDYPVFSGYAESWPVTFPGIVDQVVQLRLVDGFTVLARTAVSGSFSAQTTGQRVTAILDAIEWPLDQRDIDTGASSVPAVTLDDVPALSHLQDVEHAEGGRLFMSRDGKVTFRDRYPTVITDFSTRTWSGTTMTYRDITLSFDDDTLFNEIRLTRTGGAEQVVEDLDSVQKYFRRSLVESGIQLATDAEVLSLAEELLARYSEVGLRIEGLVDNAMKHGFWDRVLAREIQDQVLWEKTPAGSNVISQTSVIDGIHHEFDPGSWTVSFRGSPSSFTQVGILDDTTYGLLDSTMILAR